ncbi:uncharacterized protein NPIL_452641 [Nephila pilipes]|uniref:Uncharacterized protein n=1 Tax=Nephila pilipes TaxID=299642 RepID=A0A8X6N264_NEPPI|nr:uncharacterized protein NPIL_452641 [Nephila pilipes]
MIATVFLLFIGLGASTAFDLNSCDLKHCDGESEFDDFVEKEDLPTKEDLARLCPKALNYVVCRMSRMEECLEMGTEELMKSVDESQSKETLIFLFIANILDTLCDEDTTFHQDYIASVDCISRVIDEGPNEECRLIGDLKLIDLLTSNMNSIDEEVMENIACLEMPAAIGCFAADLEKSCGVAGRRTLIHFLEEIRPYATKVCSSESILKLRKDFLDDEDLENKNVYKLVFDAMKRR